MKGKVESVWLINLWTEVKKKPITCQISRLSKFNGNTFPGVVSVHIVNLLYHDKTTTRQEKQPVVVSV